MGVGGEFLEEGERGADYAPFDGGEDGGGGTEGERLRFNRQLINRQLINRQLINRQLIKVLVNRQLIKEHGEAVLNHGAQRAQTHALAAGRG